MSSPKDDDVSNDLVGSDQPASQDFTVSRRRALKVLGAVPLSAALGQQAPQQPYKPGVTPQVPTHAVVGAVQGPKFFNAHEWKTLRVLVDYIIPRDDVSGSATDAKVPEYIDYLLAEKDASVNE